MESVLLRGVVHAPNDFGEKLSVQIGQQHAQRVCLARDQTAGTAVRNVAHPAGHFANPALRLVTHGSTAIQNARDGGDGHIGFGGNILDRDHSPPSIRPVASLRTALADGELDFWPIYAWL